MMCLVWRLLFGVLDCAVWLLYLLLFVYCLLLLCCDLCCWGFVVCFGVGCCVCLVAGVVYAVLN